MASTNDPRFARLATDPRFLRPSQLKNKVVLDDRFKGILENDSEYNQAKSKVDKYGRKIGKDAKKNDLREFYRLEEGEGDGDGDEVDAAGSSSSKKGKGKGKGKSTSAAAGSVLPAKRIVDRARGEGLSESSSEGEDEDDEEEEEASDDDNDESDDSDESDIQQRQRRASSELSIDLDEDAPLASTSASAAQVESTIPTMEGSTKRIAIVNLDWDNVRAVDLYKVFDSVLSPSAAGLSLDGASATAAAGSSLGLGSRKSKSKIARGRVISVRIYPSEFGKQRLEREEREGPPVEIFSKKGSTASRTITTAASLAKKGKKGKAKRRSEDEDPSDDDDDDLLAEDAGEEYDEQALRRYQLERLRYYYAVVEFDTANAAQHAYQEIDSTEFEATANVFDLRYVPDEVSFEDTPTDSATAATVDMQAYKPLEFVTDALRNSKVKLTWDADDPERIKLTRATQDKGKKDKSKKGKEEAIDYSGLLASDSEAEDETAMSRMRAAFGLDPTREEDGSDDDDDDFFDEAAGNVFNGDRKNEMEITFTPALSGKAGADSDDDDEEGGKNNETSLEKYQRKERERRAAKKEKRKLEKKREAGGARTRLVGEENEDSDPDEAFDANKIEELGLSEEDEEDEQDNVEEEDLSHRAAAKENKKKGGKKADGFFDYDEEESADEPAAIDSSAKLSKKAQKQLEREAKEKELASLSLLVSGDGDDSNDEEGGKHFDMQEILKAEKISGKPKKVLKKGKDRRKHAEASALLQREQDKFAVDLADSRFSKLHEDHEFALDPSNPRYMKTKNMERILAESRKRRDAERPNGIDGPVSATSKANAGAPGKDGLSSLVESIKRKNRGRGEDKDRGKRQKK